MPARLQHQARSLQRQVQQRAMYTRSDGDMLSEWMEPAGVYWLGSDSGGGLVPIGPHGPFAGGQGPAKAVVARATSLITSPLTAAAFKTQDLGFAGQPFARPRWITDPMLVRSDDRFPTSDLYPAALRLPRSNFWSEWIRASIWFGLGAFIFIEGPDGMPLAGSLKNIAPYCLSTERTDDGLCWVIGDPEDGSNQVVADFDGRFNLGPVTYKLCVLRNPHSPVDTEGMSKGVFAMHPDVFFLAQQIESYSSGVFNTGVPAGFLKVATPGLQQQQADKLKADWMAAHGGSRKSIAVLNAMVDFQALSISPVDSALGEVKRLNIADTAYAFGLSPENLGVSLSGSATYANVRDHFQDLKDFGIAAWISAVEDAVTALFPGAQGVKVDLDRFENPPPQERFTAYATAIDSGWLLPEEVRVIEGLPPLPDPPAPVPVPPVPEPVPAAIEPPAPAPITRSAPAWLR